MIVRSVQATPDERRRSLPGDEFISRPIASFTHAINIRSRPHEVWPWLAQMGAGTRAGWYSYDFLDNGRKPSADRIIPQLQNIREGMVFPALPGVTEGFVIVTFEQDRFLVLGLKSPDGSLMTTWAFALEQAGPSHTRLLVRARANEGSRFHRLPWWLAKHIVRVIHAIMQRKQLLRISRRAEQTAADALRKAS